MFNTLSYLAGFLDGEGCIQISKTQRKNYNPEYHLSLTASQIHPEPLKMLKYKFGGSIFVRKSSTGRNLGVWGVSAKQAAKVLEEILPYLVVKKEQAELAILFQKSVKPTGTNRPLTSEEVEKREFMRVTLQNMKKEEYRWELDNVQTPIL